LGAQVSKGISAVVIPVCDCRFTPEEPRPASTCCAARRARWYSTDQDEDRVPHQTHPFQLVIEAAHQECQPTRVPVPMGDGVPELENAAGKQVQENHKGKAHVGTPKAYPDELLGSLPDGVGLHGPQAKDPDRERQHPENAKQGSVSVVGGECRAYLEVRHDGQVDEESENPCADKIPKHRPP